MLFELQIVSLLQLSGDVELNPGPLPTGNLGGKPILVSPHFQSTSLIILLIPTQILTNVKYFFIINRTK